MASINDLKNKVSNVKNQVTNVKNILNGNTDTSSTTSSDGSPKTSDTSGVNGKPGSAYTSTNTLATWQSSNNRISGNSRNSNIDASYFHTKDKIRNIETLDAFYRITQTLGSQQLALSNNLYGINHQGVKGVVPDNHDSYGLVFFTRPLLNLTSENIRNVRQLYSLLTTKAYSMQNYVRNMLDPRLEKYSEGKALGNYDIIAESGYLENTQLSSEQQKKWNTYKQEALNEGNYEQAAIEYANSQLGIPVQKETIPAEVLKLQLSSSDVSAYKDYLKDLRTKNKSYVTCPLVDNKMAFIPVLTNTIKEMSGWPDYTIGTFTSKEGLMKEQWSIVDSFMDIYSSFDLDCTFRNIKDEPLIIMFETWLRYMANVFEGMMSPYMDMLIENEIDYNTRIYRLVLDESKTIVKKIAACGAAFPVNVPNSRFFDYNDSNKYNDSAKDINIRFKAVGAMYNDDILVHEFNQTVGIFNPDLRKLVREGIVPSNYVEIPYNLIHLFNHRGYPIIDKNTLQLKWFINKSSKVYQELYNYYLT